MEKLNHKEILPIHKNKILQEKEMHVKIIFLVLLLSFQLEVSRKRWRWPTHLMYQNERKFDTSGMISSIILMCDSLVHKNNYQYNDKNLRQENKHSIGIYFQYTWCKQIKEGCPSIYSIHRSCLKSL